MSDTTQPRPEVSEDAIRKMLADEEFVYQRIELPFGLATRGTDRSDTARAIFPPSLAGQSVLDVGCCYGFFLYEAARRGATRLVGTERNPRRLRQAELLRSVMGVDVSFSAADFNDVCKEEQFDVVLLLNVLHHLPDPIAALRTLAAATRRRLVLEFPTLHDPKYRKRLVQRRFSRRVAWQFRSLPSDLPLIAVSSLKDCDQTFVFSEAAIRMLLTEHSDAFRQVTFVPSPMKGRTIAVCDK